MVARSERFSVAHVTPYPWDSPHEVNAHVRRISDELSRAGHRVLILAPSRSQQQVRASRRLLRAMRSNPQELFETANDGRPQVIAVGEVLDVPSGARRRTAALPIDVARTIEEVLGAVPLDFVHVHEPFAPSASSSALRHSRSLNVGSFHSPTEHLLSTQVARRFVETFFGRLDARLASSQATAQLMARHFPGEYDVLAPGTDEPDGETSKRLPASGPLRLLFIEQEERAALRLFLRALRHLGTDGAWRAVILSERGESSAAPLRANLRERVRFLTPGEIPQTRLLTESDVIVCSSEGAAPSPQLLLQALARGTVAVASRLPVYEEILGEGERGLLFEPGDTVTLAGQLTRLTQEPALLRRLRDASLAYTAQLTWDRSARRLEGVYQLLDERRHRHDWGAPQRRTLARRALIDVDLHMHTDHSHDCATPVEVLLATAREQGLGAIAVTDHNEISGALEAQEKGAAAGVKVIVGEEVKTAEQGEVIGLFIKEKIPRGLTLQETVQRIREQDGVVYVPHPFDRLHSVPDYEHLLRILGDVDAIEIYNPRVAIGAFNEEAARFAAKYRILAGAGSDSHVAQGLGSVRIRMRDFDGPQEFLCSLSDAEIITRPTSLLYVQALKFLQTRATPPAARKASRARRVRRATQASKRNG